jgi:hypothetical protein
MLVLFKVLLLYQTIIKMINGPLSSYIDLYDDCVVMSLVIHLFKLNDQTRCYHKLFLSFKHIKD